MSFSIKKGRGAKRDGGQGAAVGVGGGIDKVDKQTVKRKKKKKGKKKL